MRSTPVMCWALVAAWASAHTVCVAQTEVALPTGVRAVWDLQKAYRETTPTRERVSINGLWQWQPTSNTASRVPAGDWGYFKVPGSWPGYNDYMRKDSQTLHKHPTWAEKGLRSAAWYQRNIEIPAGWAGRRIAVYAEYVNSYAAVYVDGRLQGEILFPWGEVDITAACRPGDKHVLSLHVIAMPAGAVIRSYNDTNSAKEVKGSVDRRGLCGDVWLVATPAGARLADVKIDTSVRRGEIGIEAGLLGLASGATYGLSAVVTEGGREVARFKSPPFTTDQAAAGRHAFVEKWQPPKLWDTHTPQNLYHLQLSLLDAAGRVLDTLEPARFGFRELWIEGRDFYLNGTRLYMSSVPLDSAQGGAAMACYAGARETLQRLQSFGINFVYTHNYDCQPGSHISFREILRAADDVGMLVALSQPHFGHYNWDKPDAETNYARHAEFYVRMAQNHPSVFAYATSHNATGYTDDMNPDKIDGVYEVTDGWSLNNRKKAARAEAIIQRLDPGRIVYHHSSGNFGPMHTSNFYPNWAPVQELDDWFEHWATEGVKPVFLCEYGAPFPWDWAMYRGWYKGARTFGGGQVPWEYCLAEWNAQFLGDPAFQISEREAKNLRWEAKRFRAGATWKRWDYPYEIGSPQLDECQPAYALYTASNWRAFRTWGLSVNSPWAYGPYWKLRDGVNKERKELSVDWENLQRPGFSPDFLADQRENFAMGYERSDWVPTPTAQALYRNNLPLLAYIAGQPARFTSKDHNFLAGETVEKQLIVINNSRVTVSADCSWSLGLPQPVAGQSQVTVETGQQKRLPLRLAIPAAVKPGAYTLTAKVTFGTGEVQQDAFALHVLPGQPAVKPAARIAVFDPKGETAKLLASLGVTCQAIEATSDLAAFDVLVLGKGALTVDGPGPDLRRVRDGLKVIAFEQTSAALEKRLGFRVVEYGLRNVFKRVPDHPALAGLEVEHLRDWRGVATLVPPRAHLPKSKKTAAPTTQWCGLDVSRVWRCGCQGNVASVLIEKPARGDFLPIVDGGFSLQFSPLLEFREGRGMMVFCQMDVTGRTENDPAAERLARNLLAYVTAWQPTPRRTAVYAGDPAGRAHLERAGVAPTAYEGGTLAPDHVLVLGSGAAAKLARHAAAIGAFVKAGGGILALGLDEAEANACLPVKVTMKTAEHIAACFEPPGMKSLLAGVGPADVHNRDPHELPLLTGGATVLGNGVLAQAENAPVVFCQHTPFALLSGQGVQPFVMVDKEAAADGTRSVLMGTGGAASGAGGQVSQSLTTVIPEVGKTYTFAVQVMGVGSPVTVRLEVERAAKPWDRAIKGPDVVVPADRWMDVHVSFKVDKAYPQGWAAYVACAQPAARFRVDSYRLYPGEYAANTPAVDTPENLFKNPSFEKGTNPWSFSYSGQRLNPTTPEKLAQPATEPAAFNLRRTYRRSSCLLARLLGNMGVASSTPLLERFGQTADAGKDKRWLDGLYLDTPEEWDDPYRFFRW